MSGTGLICLAGMAVALHASLTLANSKSEVLSPLVLQITYCVKSKSVFEMLTSRLCDHVIMMVDCVLQ